jgi:hypothetical protein
VPDEQRAEQVEGVLDRQPTTTRRLFAIRRFDDTVAFLASEARS